MSPQPAPHNPDAPPNPVAEARGVALEADRLLAAIVESSDDAILSKGLDGTILSWNASATRLFGYTAAEAVGQHISLIIPPDRLGEEAEIVATLRQGRRVEHFETERRTRAGGLVAVSVTASPIRDARGVVVGASTIARDVSGRREAEARERSLLREVSQADAKFRALFDQGALLAGILLTDGTAVEVNRLATEGCGYTREQIVGKPVWEGPWWGSDATRARVREACAVAAAGGVFEGRLPFVVGDGSHRVAQVLFHPIRNNAGEVVFLAPTGVDITDQVQAETALRESAELFRTMADNIAQLAWMADAEGLVFWFNQRWFDYTGTRLDEAQGWGWKQVVHPDHADRVVNRIQHAWDTGDVWEDTFPLRQHDGEYRWFLSRAVPIRDDMGRVRRWFGTNTEITDKQRLEEGLRVLADDLTKADRRKDEFLATLAHELRNPLAPIRYGLHALRMAPDDAAEVATVSGIMERQVSLMVRLIDDLLDVSRVSSGKVRLRKERVDLAEVVATAVESVRPLFDAAGHRLSIDLPAGGVVLDADPVRLTQVVANLLNNAAKFTEPGGQVWVAARREGDELSLSVRDTGVGIPPEFLDRVFDMFAQGDESLTRSQGGLGIGLTLTKTFVELHGGRMLARSDGPGRGSEFVVVLPLVADAGPASGATPPGPASDAQRPLDILVVDDTRAAAVVLGKLLSKLGHSVRVAGDGATALAEARRKPPELIVSDIAMPEMDGYELAGHVRRDPGLEGVALVALTGYGQESDLQRAVEAGFDAHLVKPASLDALASLLKSLPRLQQPAIRPANC